MHKVALSTPATAFADGQPVVVEMLSEAAVKIPIGAIGIIADPQSYVQNIACASFRGQVQSIRSSFLIWRQYFTLFSF